MTTARETLNTLTGFEEDAIEQCTGMTVDTMADPPKDLAGRATNSYDVKLTRSLAMVLVYRAGGVETYAAAWQKVQGMSQVDLAEVFEDEPDDVMPDEPDSAAGKDESPKPDEHTSSPHSVSQPV